MWPYYDHQKSKQEKCDNYKKLQCELISMDLCTDLLIENLILIIKVGITKLKQ